MVLFPSLFRVSHEELVDDRTRVGSARIREDAPGGTAGPGMVHSVDLVVGDHVAAVDVLPRVHGVGPFPVRPGGVINGAAGMFEGGREVPPPEARLFVVIHCWVTSFPFSGSET